jgi:hypothetical protein
MSNTNNFNTLPSHTVWIVWVSVILTAALMTLQFIGERWFGLVGSLPHDTAAWGLAFIVSGYTGTDRIAYFVKSKTLEYGTQDLGDVRKLRLIIFLMLGLVIEAIVLRVFFGLEGIAVEQLLIGFSASGGLYAIGNKAIKAASSMTGTHSIDTMTAATQTIITAGSTFTSDSGDSNK